MPVSLLLPWSKHEVDQTYFHGEISYLSVKVYSEVKSGTNSLTSTVSSDSCLPYSDMSIRPCAPRPKAPMLWLRHRALRSCPKALKSLPVLLVTCWPQAFVFTSLVLLLKGRVVIFTYFLWPLAIFGEKLKISLTSELAEALQGVVGNSGTVPLQKEKKRKYRTGIKIKIARLSWKQILILQILGIPHREDFTILLTRSTHELWTVINT